ncbi:MAG: hypothetical protein K0R50_3418 [Eubacterium sp.]|jgi:hypothetical protein|nr:hypothetical protein [Eubacterium sp.]
MKQLKQKANRYAKIYSDIKRGEKSSSLALPSNTYFIENDEILSIPRNDGDNRYPYGLEGFNFWAYASGYMHCNEGLFSPFIRAAEGQEPKIAFFAGMENSDSNFDITSLLSVPILKDSIVKAERYTVFAKSSVYYITETKDVRFTIRCYVNKAKTICFSVLAENMSENPQKISLSSYMNPFLVHDINENGENRWFREARYLSDDKDRLGSFVIKTNEDISRTLSVSNYGVIHRYLKLEGDSKILGHEETTSRYQYVGGNRSSLHSPEALFNGTFGKSKHVCAFTEVGIAGDIIHLSLGAGESIRYDLSLSCLENCRDDSLLRELILKKSDFDSEKIDMALTELEQLEGGNKSNLQVNMLDIEDNTIEYKKYNPFFEHMKKQVEFCSLIKGYIQLAYNSLIGIRDVFQAIEGMLFFNPSAARNKMLEALNFISPDGRCPRQYSLPAKEGEMPVMDIRPFIDQGTWVISTIITYLKFTGDFNFLHEKCGYYEILDEKKKVVKRSNIYDSVLDHMLKIMEYLLINRDFEQTNCICALYGDWNDALDGLGVSQDPEKEYGSGVSVMATLQVYQNLNEMLELFNQIKSRDFSELEEKYRKAANEIEEGLRTYAIIQNSEQERRIVHGWGDKRSYLVGSFCDSDNKSRYGLTSNAYWVISGLYEKDMSIRDTILHAFKELDSEYGIKTFDPHFEPNTFGVGRIPKLPAGTYENGATYNHATAFAIMALFGMGCPEMAWEQINKIVPFTHTNVSTSPFVMPNSYGHNEELLIDGESVLDWQTGASNVLLKLFIKYVFGFQPSFGGLYFQPAAWSPFESFDFKINVRGCKLHINYIRKGKAERTFILNGKTVKGVYDEKLNITRLWIPYTDIVNNQAVSLQIND